MGLFSSWWEMKSTEDTFLPNTFKISSISQTSAWVYANVQFKNKSAYKNKEEDKGPIKVVCPAYGHSPFLSPKDFYLPDHKRRIVNPCIDSG